MSLALSMNAASQRVLTLDSCEFLAIRNNKGQKIAAAEIEQAQYEKKAAFGQYFPNISIKGGYFRNEKKISLLGEDALLPIGTVMQDGSFGFSLPTMQADGTIASSQLNNKWMMVNGTAVPLDANGKPFNQKTNPEKLLWKEKQMLLHNAVIF